VEHKTRIQPAADHRDVGLEVKPPDIVRYFVRVKDNALNRFCEKNTDWAIGPPPGGGMSFIFRNSFQINPGSTLHWGTSAPLCSPTPVILVIFKIVGFAEQVVKYTGSTTARQDMDRPSALSHQRQGLASRGRASVIA